MPVISLPKAPSSLPGKFSEATDKVEHELIRIEGDVQIPLGRMHQVGAALIPVEKLAANIASAFNGNNPIYRFGEGLEMLYHPHEGGVDFHFRKKGEDGVSAVGVRYMSFSLEGDLTQLIENAPVIFGHVMESCGEERRKKSRAQNVDGKKHSPKSAPMPPAG